MLIESLMILSGAFLSSETVQVLDSVSVDTLGMVEVTAKNIRRDAKGSTLTVSSKMRKKHMDALQLLKEFPEVRYNPVSEQITINGMQNIAYQIDGVDKTLEEVKSIPMDAVQHVEIIHMVDGKYIADGIRYVVDFQLKKNYMGFDFMAQNLLAASPNKDNGDDAIACEQPKATVMYRNEKWSINAMAAYGLFNWNYPITVEKGYEGEHLMSSSATPRHPNQLTSRKEYVYRLAADYNFDKSKTLSLNAVYNPSANKEHSFFDFIPYGNNASEGREENHSKKDEDNLKFSLNYIGAVSPNWRIDMNAGLNYAVYDNDYAFAYSGQWEYASNRQSKRYAYGRFSTQYIGWEKCMLDLGAMYTFNQYKTEQATGDAHIDTHRYSAFAFATYNISDYWNMRAGLTVGGVQGSHNNDLYVLPTVNLSHASENGKIAFEFQYSIAPEYAKLYQLSEASYRLNQVMMHQGNPKLRSFSNVHQLNGMLTLWGWLTLQEELEYNRHHADEFYFKRNEMDFSQTYENARYFRNATTLTASFDLSGAFSVEGTIGFRYNKVHHPQWQLQNHRADLLANVSVSYLNEKKALSVTAEYSKNKESQCILQGYRQIGQDMCQITILKSWLSGKLRGQLGYMVPLHWGLSHLQKETIKTDFYHMSQNMNLRTYDNMLFLRLTYLLHKGKKSPRIADTGIYDDETKPGRKLFGNE